MTEIIGYSFLEQKVCEEKPRSEEDFTSSLQNCPELSELKNSISINGDELAFTLNREGYNFYILAIVSFSKAISAIKLKIFSNEGKELRAVSRYQKVTLMNYFLSKQLHSIWKINPISGIISVEKSWFDDGSFCFYRILELVHQAYAFCQEEFKEIEKVVKILEGNAIREDYSKIESVLILCGKCSNYRRAEEYNPQALITKKIQEHSKFVLPENKLLQSLLINSEYKDFQLAYPNREIECIKYYLNYEKKYLRSSLISRKVQFGNLNYCNKFSDKKSQEIKQKMEESSKFYVKIPSGGSEMFLECSQKNVANIAKEYKILEKLPKDEKIEFFESYFRITELEKANLLTKMAVDKKTLKNYLVSNANSISLRTKLKIILQLLTSFSLMWVYLKVIYSDIRINQLHLTKSLCLKFQNLQNLQEFQLFKSDEKSIQSRQYQLLYSFVRIYYFIMFNQRIPPYDHKKNNDNKGSRFNIFRESFVVDSINENVHEGPVQFTKIFNYVLMKFIDEAREDSKGGAPNRNMSFNKEIDGIKWMQVMVLIALDDLQGKVLF